jgi:two-component system, NarL family, nitrate/nitrite response regulator NarL
MNKPLNIIVADFHPYLLKGVIAELENEKNLRIVAALQTLNEIENTISTFSANVLITGYWFREDSVLNIIKKIRAKHSFLKIIIYTQEERSAYVKEMINYVDGYILKSEPLGVLTNAIYRVMLDKKAISEDIRECLSLDSNFNHKLSSQEHKIITCRVDGMNPNHISEQLSISEKTVRKHIDNARKKLGFNTTEEMIRWYWQQQ